jgi:hypothetical protein
MDKIKKGRWRISNQDEPTLQIVRTLQSIRTLFEMKFTLPIVEVPLFDTARVKGLHEAIAEFRPILGG